MGSTYLTHRERQAFFSGQVPDVVNDPITDTARALNVPTIERVFFEAAKDAGFTDPQAVATHRYNQWKHNGYQALPPYIKDFCLRTCASSSKSKVVRFLHADTE